MPLKAGYSDKIISKNISELIDAGYSHDRAVAAALNTARKAFKKKYPGKSLPERLKK